MFRCYLPKIEFGEGRLQNIGEIAKPYGSRAILIIDPFWASHGLENEIIGLLNAKDIQVVVYSDIEPNPSCFTIDETGEMCRREKCEMIIAVGGGSAIDFGKALAIVAQNPDSSWSYTERADHDILRPKNALPIIAIPTTAGTGSETTPFAVLNNPKIKEKSTIVSDMIFPQKSIIDPILTYTMPPRLTASTGFDAFSHALESYISLLATPFSRMVAKEAMCIAVKFLPIAVKNGKDEKARAKMAWASALGGASIAYVGVTLPHSLGQPIGGMFGAPHGESVAACMVEILKSSFSSNPQAFADISEILYPKIAGLSINEKASMCPELVQSFLNNIDLNVRFSDFGMTKNDIDNAVKIALSGYYFDIKCHPKETTENDIREIYTRCL